MSTNIKTSVTKGNITTNQQQRGDNLFYTVFQRKREKRGAEKIKRGEKEEETGNRRRKYKGKENKEGKICWGGMRGKKPSNELSIGTLNDLVGFESLLARVSEEEKWSQMNHKTLYLSKVAKGASISFIPIMSFTVETHKDRDGVVAVFQYNGMSCRAADGKK